MQDTFILNLKFMNDNDEMKEDLVEIKLEKNTENGAPFNAVRCLLVYATQHIPPVTKESFRSPCAIRNKLLV